MALVGRCVCGGIVVWDDAENSHCVKFHRQDKERKNGKKHKEAKIHSDLKFDNKNFGVVAIE